MQDIAKALRGVNPDILCLQEVQGQNLKRLMMHNKFSAKAQHEWFGEYLKLENSYGKNAEYQHGHHGNAVLSRHPLDPMHNVNITVSRLEQRGVLHCEVRPKGWDKAIVVLCAHLNLLERDRSKQYDVISQYVNDVIDPQQPLILAGDFNDWKKKSGVRMSEGLNMQEAFMHCHNKLMPTFPATLPILSLDRIYMRNLEIKKAWVHKGSPWNALSDHLPVSAEFGLAL